MTRLVTCCVSIVSKTYNLARCKGLIAPTVNIVAIFAFIARGQIMLLSLLVVVQVTAYAGQEREGPEIACFVSEWDQT